MSRVLRLFELLAHRREGMTLSELSLALDVPKSTFLNSLRALVADGFLLVERNRYFLGPCAFRLAGTLMSAWSLPDLIRHYVRDLAQSTAESVGFAIADWDIGQAIYTDGVNSTQPVHYAMRVGIRAPLYASASGRVLLAFAPPELRETYFERTTFKAFTTETRTTREALDESIQAILSQGYCASFGEMLKDTAALAVPVFDARGTNMGAMMLAAPRTRLERNFDHLLGQLIRCGRQASGLMEESPVPE